MEENLQLKKIKWKSNISRLQEEFSEIIEDDDIFEKYFGEEYLEKLVNKSKSIMQTVIKLGLVYTVLMLSLFATQYSSTSDFEIFGYGFRNLSQYKELFLFLATIVSPISAVLLAYRNYIDALIKECLYKLSPDVKMRKFYSQKFISDYLDPLIDIKAREYSYPHFFPKALLTVFIVVFFFLFLTLLAGSFFVQISVIYDVIVNPALSKYINLFVISFAIASIFFFLAS